MEPGRYEESVEVSAPGIEEFLVPEELEQVVEETPEEEEVTV